MSRLSEKLRTTFSRLVLEWGISTRYLVALPLTFQIVTMGRDRKASRLITAQTYDISESGLGILSQVITADGLHVYFSNDMITNTLLEIQLEMPDRAIKFTGQTCRYQKLEKGEFPYLLGVKIVKIAEDDKKVLQKYISTLRRSSINRTPHY